MTNSTGFHNESVDLFGGGVKIDDRSSDTMPTTLRCLDVPLGMPDYEQYLPNIVEATVDNLTRV